MQVSKLVRGEVMRAHHKVLFARFDRGGPGIDHVVLTAATWIVTELRYQEIWSFLYQHLTIIVHLHK